MSLMKSAFKKLSLMAIVLCSAACAKHEPVETWQVESDDILNPFINENNAFIPKPGSDVKREDPLNLEQEQQVDIDLVSEADRPEVRRWIDYFAVKNRARFERFMERGSTYQPLISTMLRENGLPEDIFYIALIESGFNLKARSHASAVGPWQFMKGTGKRFGLKVNSYVDERLDPIRSTLAAIKYLKSLNKVFDSWFLAFAAYNSGESRVMNAIIRHSVRDFWKLAEIKGLPRETRNYVPKFIAAALIAKNPRKYGFSFKVRPPMTGLVAAKFPSPVRLSAISKISGVSTPLIRKMNPHLFKGHTPPSSREYKVWLPNGRVPSVANITTLKRMRRSAAYAKTSNANSKNYRVRRGDSLYSIGRKYKVSIARLKKENHLRRNTIFPGSIIKIPGRAKSKRLVKYRIRRGDSLYQVAQRFGLSIKRLKKLNSMKHSRIYAGQYIKVPGNRS